MIFLAMMSVRSITGKPMRIVALKYLGPVPPPVFVWRAEEHSFTVNSVLEKQKDNKIQSQFMYSLERKEER